MTNYDVLIVGAGPVGLMLACELARRGVSHRLIESKERRERYCKALGVTPRTLEVFDQMGLLDEALRLGFHLTAMSIVVGDQVVKRVVRQPGEIPYGNFAMAQPDTEEVLEGFWSRFGHTIDRGKSLASFVQDDSGVTATLEGGQQVRARYLVGCDGAHSKVRKALGVSFEGEKFERTFLLGDVHIDWDRPHQESWQVLLFDGEQMVNNVTFISNPTAPGRYRVSTSVDPDADCPESPSLEYLMGVIGPAIPEGVTVSDLRWSSRYNISHRIAGAYRQGRVFLAGDAAHIHPPIGGLGMNTGLQDAHNLGWKLAAVCRGEMDESLLETYNDERQPVGAMVVQITGARMAAAMRGEDSRALQEPPMFDTQLRVRYEAGPLVGGETPAAGLPRPGDSLRGTLSLQRPGEVGPVRLAEVLRDGRFHLFTHEVDHHAFAQEFETAMGRRGRAWRVLSQEPGEAMGYFLDGDGGWSREVGIGAVLLRPDGVIGWRGGDTADLRQWLARIGQVATPAGS